MEEGLKNLLHWLNLGRMGVMWVVALLFSYLKLLHGRLFDPHAHLSHCAIDPGSLPLACIITGASSGIGKSTAEVLALKGYYIILAGRSITRLCKVAEELQLRHRSITVKALEVDLGSTVSILQFTEAVEKLLETCDGSIPLQLLINNAGILATTKRVTSEGYESMIATNYLGHYLLTHLLLPHMQRSRVPARVVNVGSFTHHCVQSFDGLLSLLQQGEMQKNRDSCKGSVYQIARTYETSKLFMTMFTYELHRRLNAASSSFQVTAMVADPGVVRTAIFRELPRWFSSCIFTCLRSTGLLSSPSSGCKAVIDAALAPPGMSGKYIFGGHGRVVTSSALSYDKQFAADLWALSWRLCSDAMPQNKLLPLEKNQKATLTYTA